MAVEHSIKELKGRRASRKQSGSRRPAVPSSLFTNTSNLRRALTDSFNAAVGTTWKALTVGSDVSVLSGEREVELLEEGQLPAFFVTFLRSFYTCAKFIFVRLDCSRVFHSLKSTSSIAADLRKDVFNPKKFHYDRARYFTDALNDKCSNGLWQNPQTRRTKLPEQQLLLKRLMWMLLLQRFYLICFLNKQIEFKKAPKSFVG